MLPLLNSIYSAFTASSLLTGAFPGGLHRDEAPEGTAMPYLVSRVVESKVQHSFNGPYRTQTTVRFSAYGVGHDAAGALANGVVAIFDTLTLSLSAGSHTGTTRTNEPTPKLHRHDADGNDVWEWEVEYVFDVLD